VFSAARNLLIFLILTLAFTCSYGQSTQRVSSDTAIDFTVSKLRGLKGDGDVVYMLEQDNQTLTANRQSIALWTVNVINQCGEPATGNSVVRYICLQADKLQIVFGKHSHAKINIYTGELTCEGDDKLAR
jgi:hypothetical protein